MGSRNIDSSALVRVLLVDDFEPFRRYVRSLLQERPELLVVCEVSDGSEGVRRAGELQPELVFLDNHLPKLNGIEAARQIRVIAPQSKIIFISQESSPAIVREALSLGVRGYVAKLNASELLAAIDAVLRGDRFVSSSLDASYLAEATDD